MHYLRHMMIFLRVILFFHLISLFTCLISSFLICVVRVLFLITTHALFVNFSFVMIFQVLAYFFTTRAFAFLYLFIKGFYSIFASFKII